MKSPLENEHARLRRSSLALAALTSVVACGVVEHPHDVKALDSSGDFAPAGGTGAIAGTPSTGGVVASGAAGGNGGASNVAGTTGTGGGGGVGGTPVTTGGSVATGGGGPAPSGVTINLGGVDVPKEKVIAFIHIGHSNMAGQARSPFGSRAYHYTETNPHAFMYHVGSPPELAKEPTAGGPGGGPGTALVKEAVAMAPDYYFISLGYGEPSAYCSQFVPGALYYDNKTTGEGVIVAPRAIKGKVTFGGIFLYFGITERHGSAADVNGFPNCINTLVTAIRQELGEPNWPVLMNDYEVEASGEFAVGGAVYNNIYPQIQKVPSVVANSALVSAATIAMEDDHHFNFDGQRTWAQRALTTMKQKGWFPWAP